MREGITLSAGDRSRLEAVVADRNSPQKHVWRARIVLLTAAGLARRRSCGRPARARPPSGAGRSASWAEGVDGLLRDKTRPSRIPPLAPAVSERVVALTLADPPGETTHWTAARWPRRPASASARCSGSGAAHGLQPHRVRQLQAVQRPAVRRQAAATSSGSTSTRRRMRWCCRSTRKRRSRRSTAPSPGCR